MSHNLIRERQNDSIINS